MKIIHLDMDGVLVDLGHEFEKWFQEHPNLIHKYKHSPDHIPGIFRDPRPIDGAIDAVKKLSESNKYELFIATAAPWGNPCSSTDKRYWVEKISRNKERDKEVSKYYKKQGWKIFRVWEHKIKKNPEIPVENFFLNMIKIYD